MYKVSNSRPGTSWVRQVVDPQANVLLVKDYSPYGEVLSSTGKYQTAFDYTGEMVDGTGLVYLRARYYDPATGRFFARDPFAGFLIQPASQNGYSYALNNPILYTDPKGEFIDTLLDVASVGYDIYMIIHKSNMGCDVSWKDWAALGLDAVSLVIPFVPAMGMAIHLAARADDVADLEMVRNTGKIGEQLAGIKKKIQRE